MRWLALLVLAAGCGGAQGGRPGEAEALAIAWYQELGMTSVPPPIEWRADDCGARGREGFTWEGRCYAGLYLRDDRALLAWEGSFHASALAHELMHARQWLAGIEDPEHRRGEDWRLVDSAERALEESGL